MGKDRGFLEYERELPSKRSVSLRVLDWKEVNDTEAVSEEKVSIQGARCMDCGIPFCQNGCPLGNLIPDWNDLVYKGRWKEALEMLHKTNNFPEFTGAVCPAPCEESCVLNIDERPVTIKFIENSIIETAFKKGWIALQPPTTRTGKKVAIIGSGPAGLACADQLNRAGHNVTVFERDAKIGGLLTYGIPNFKLEKHVVARRVRLLEAEGVRFKKNAHVGHNVDVHELVKEYDAICLAGGSTKARDLNVPGRELDGVHFAMDFLTSQNRVDMGEQEETTITAKDKNVVILGGGDTGADCLGTSIRQGARSVHQFELLPKPPEGRTSEMPWPSWPMILRESTSHEEGGIRDWSINTVSFSDENGTVKKLHAVRLNWKEDENGRLSMEEVPDSEFTIDCDLCLLALGFVHPEHPGPIEQLGLELDGRGNVATDKHYATSLPGIFAAGDLRRGQSLVVWAIAEGREAAASIDNFLMSS